LKTILKVTVNGKMMLIKLKNIIHSKYPVVRQYEKTDCGPAALLAVLKYHGGNDHLVHVRELCRTTMEGTTMLDMVFAAEKLGFKAQGARGDYESLVKEKLPCIAHVIVDNRLQHFMVVYKMYKNKITLGDPAKGLVVLTRDEFETIWKSKIVLLLKPGSKLYHRAPQSRIIWLRSYIKEESVWIYQALFLGTVYTSLGLLTAFFIQRLIDDFIPKHNLMKIGYTGGFLLILLILKASAGYLRQKFLVIVNKRLSLAINADFVEHLFKLPKKFFGSRKKGDVTARIHDIIKIQQAILHLLSWSFIDLLIIIGSLLSMFYFSSLLGWIVLGFFPLYFSVLIIHTKSLKRQQNDVMKGFARVESVYIESLEGIDDILSFNASESFSKSNKLIFRLFQDNIEVLGFTRTRLSFIAEISGSMITIAVLILGALSISGGAMQVGEMIACYSLLSYLIPAFNRSIDVNISLQGALVALRRLMELRLIEEEKDTGKQSFIMNDLLNVKRAKFSWAANKKLLRGVDIQIPKGKLISLWGPSGAGKSTLVQLIQRKYEPEGGTITLDGLPVHKIKLQEYRQNIAIVPQEIKVFNGTLGENILLGRPISSHEELTRLMDRFSFTDFFNRFEKGLHTHIGEDIRQLSGGEKQMLGLARALYDFPRILIIDEGLNSIDMEIENLIFSILSEYVRCHAVLICTHNLRILRKTEFLYVIKDGDIIQRGSPDMLLRECGYFHSVFRAHKRKQDGIRTK
jgi:ABC-type bacteriocin/lantibiotic exporter with double-glycine peptidase domain